MNGSLDVQLRYSHSRHSRINRWLSLGSIGGPILFALAYIIVGLLRPGYSLVSQPVSSLGVGRYAMAMNASFVIMGLLIFVGVIAIFGSVGELGPIARWCCIILFELSPIGAFICGIYNFETFMLHFSGFILACGSPIISYLVVGLMLRRYPVYRRFANWLIVGSPLTLILFCWFMATFNYLHTDVGIAGLTERILILEVHAFYVALGWFTFRRSRESR